MNRPTLLILALVTLLVFATSWLSRKSEQPTAPTGTDAVDAADYFIHGFEGTVTGKNGAPSHYIKAESLVHYGDSNVTELEQPSLTVYHKPGEQWHVQSSHGRMQGEGENDEVLLDGKVILNQRSKRQPLKLTTEKLLLYPGRRYAETDSAVDISTPSGRIKGVGMKVFGDEERLQLLSDIRGIYDAPIR
jgi:lipopolysaccharide export system protein LptC